MGYIVVGAVWVVIRDLWVPMQWGHGQAIRHSQNIDQAKFSFRRLTAPPTRAAQAVSGTSLFVIVHNTNIFHFAQAAVLAFAYLLWRDRIFWDDGLNFKLGAEANTQTPSQQSGCLPGIAADSAQPANVGASSVRRRTCLCVCVCACSSYQCPIAAPSSSPPHPSQTIKQDSVSL